MSTQHDHHEHDQAPSPRERQAFHEAGHLVVEHRLRGGPLLVGASITPGHGCRGAEIGAGESALAQEQRVIALYAGFEAKVALHPRGDIECRPCVRDDFEEADRIVQRLRSDDDLLRASLRRFSRDYVATNWREIKIIAWALLRWESLDGPTCDALLEFVNGGDPKRAAKQLERCGLVTRREGGDLLSEWLLDAGEGGAQ